MFFQQAEVKEEEEIKMKAKEEDLRKVFQTTVSLCVHSGLMTPERAQSYYRSSEIYCICVCVCVSLCSMSKYNLMALLSSPGRRPAIRSGQPPRWWHRQTLPGLHPQGHQRKRREREEADDLTSSATVRGKSHPSLSGEHLFIWYHTTDS